MKKKLLVVGIIGVLMAGMFTGCSESTSSKENSYTEETKNQILDMYGMPQISNGYEYSQLKEIYEMRDDPNLICYWYTKNDMSGLWVYQGKCIGYGIPYGASITNPEQYNYNRTTLPLAEPNGLYTNGVTSSATWVLAVDEDGNITPSYVEDSIYVTQKKVESRLCETEYLPADYDSSESNE